MALKVLSEEEVRQYEPATPGSAREGYQEWHAAILGLQPNQGVHMSIKDWRDLGYKVSFPSAVGALVYCTGRKQKTYLTKTRKAWVSVRIK